ncbi:hypothetical protein [Nocardioides sp.]|uniref:HNH endonuclease n=1 Tax=Nocardioides sp. TaxID=35761 RepID=UPI002C88A425|nr:hypothetical protein [Nocardioides sp.]HSX69096.1 hypothetical protein [Nocardioides sp.]
MQMTPIGVEYDDQAAVLRWAAQHRRMVQHSDAQQLAAAVRWASFHSTDARVGSAAPGDERAMQLGGEGTPEVTEFCVAEFAAVIGKSTDSGRLYMGDALELAHRLPRIYARVIDDSLEVWRARQIAQNTRFLPPAGAAFIDGELAPVAHKVGIVTLRRLVEEALVRFDPEQAQIRAAAAAEARDVKVCRDDSNHAGIADIHATVDLADADDFEAAIARRAAHLGADGDDEPLEVRRAKALGAMARADLGLDLTTGARTSGPSTEVKVHVNAADLAAGTGLARVERTGSFIHMHALRRWLSRPDMRVAVRAVIDTTATTRVDQWEIPNRLRVQVIERDGHCVFPHCNRSAHSGDVDHLMPYDPDGPPGQTNSGNLASLCRTHHRHKTFTGWSYTMVEPGYNLWRSPHGHRFLVTPTGTQQL